MSDPGAVWPVVFAAGGLLLVGYFVVALVTSCRRVAGPNEALIVSGGVRGARVILRGGVFVLPRLERVDSVSLELIQLRVSTEGARSLNGVPVHVVASVQVQVQDREEKILAVAELFPPGHPHKLHDAVVQIVRGQLHAFVGQMTNQQILSDLGLLALRVQEAAAGELDRMGLRILGLSVLQVEDLTPLAVRDFAREFAAGRPSVFRTALTALLIKKAAAEQPSPASPSPAPPSSRGYLWAALDGVVEVVPELRDAVEEISLKHAGKTTDDDDLCRWLDQLVQGASRGDPGRTQALLSLSDGQVTAAVREAVVRMTPDERSRLEAAVRDLANPSPESPLAAVETVWRTMADSAAVRHSLLSAAHERIGRPRPLATREVIDGRFEVIEVLGEGGMGEVYRVWDRRREKDVALKLLRRSLLDDGATLARFRKEVNLALELTHPHIVRVHDVGEASGRPYLHMEWVDGVTLRARLAAGPCSLSEALPIARGFLSGLAYAHEQGVLHLDVKPENILLGRAGEVKLADLGLARGIGLDGMRSLLTGAGTPHYMAPEQIKAGGEVDKRSDVFSAGVVLYEMLTGEPPIGAFEPLPDSIPEPLRAAVHRALSQRRERRQADAGELLAALPTA